MRCRSPPENSCGYLCASSRLRPTISSNCTTRARRSCPCSFSYASRGSATISFTSQRGFRDQYGSWNTICTFFLNAFRFLRSSENTSLPSKYTFPSVGSYRFRIVLTKVDFPHPLSPTMPRTSPLFRVKLTSSTALRLSFLFFFLTSKYFLRCSTRSSSSPVSTSSAGAVCSRAASTSMRVYSCSGARIIRSVSPSSIIRPS